MCQPCRRLDRPYKPVEPLQFRLEISFASESHDVQIAVPDRTTVDGYGAVDLAATWDVHPAWQLLARIDNLTDTSYEHFIGFPQPGITGSVGLRYVLPPPTSVMFLFLGPPMPPTPVPRIVPLSQSTRSSS